MSFIQLQILESQDFHQSPRAAPNKTGIFKHFLKMNLKQVKLQWCPIKMRIFIKMRAACFAPSLLQKRGVMKRGWLQFGSSHFNEKFSLL